MEIKEFKERPNTHQLHLEQLVTQGPEGLEELNDKIEKFMTELNGQDTGLNTTTKIDGAPAVVCWSSFPGYPDNSICLKSFITSNKNCLSSSEEIKSKYGDRPDMTEKLLYCLELAKCIPANEAWQGDCLYSKGDLKEREIQGKNYLTFHPNKIIYAFSEDNPTYETIKNSDFGICFHTIYKPASENKKTQSFRVNAERLNNVPNNIYVMSPALNKSSNKADYNIKEVLLQYDELKKLEQQLLSNSDYEDLCDNSVFMSYWNTFENANLSDKRAVNIDVNTFFEELKDYIKDKQTKAYDKKMSTLKTDAGKERATNAYNAEVIELEDILDTNKGVITLLVKTLNLAANIKMNLWNGFKKSKQGYDTFYKSKSQGYIPADMEGVAMSDADGNIVKVVDRSTFSFANRSDDIESGFEHNESLEESHEDPSEWPEDLFNVPDKLYHATYGAYLDKIREEGIKPGVNNNWGFSNKVICLSPDLDEAGCFAEAADEISDEVFESGVYVLEIDFNKLDKNHLAKDKNTSPWFDDEEERWYGVEFEYDKVIPFDAVNHIIDYSNYKIVESVEPAWVKNTVNKVQNSDKDPAVIATKAYHAKKNGKKPIKGAVVSATPGLVGAIGESLNEDVNKTAVLAFGRMNPPTIGHNKLIDTMAQQEGDKKLYLSHTQDSKKNPLAYDQKLAYVDKAFGDRVEVVKSQAKTVIQALQELYDQGYTNIIYVGGEDRIGGEEDITATISKYNGQPDKQGNVLYKFDNIDFVNAGGRSANSNDFIETVSASMVRELVRNNNLEDFKKCVPFDDATAEDLFHDIQVGLNLKESIISEATLGIGEIDKNNYSYYDSVVNDYVGDGVELDDGSILHAGDRYKPSQFDEIKDTLLSLKSLDNKEVAKQFEAITGTRWTKIFKGKYSNYARGTGGKGLEAEVAVRDNKDIINDLLSKVKPYLEKQFGKIDKLDVVNIEHCGGANNKRGVSFEDLFNTEGLYDGVTSGPSTSDKIADVIYYVNIETTGGKIIDHHPLYLSIKEGDTNSPINLGLQGVNNDVIINSLTNGLDKYEYNLFNTFLSLKGKPTAICVAANGDTSWVYKLDADKINEQCLKNALINSYGNNYYYVHLNKGKIDKFADVEEIRASLKKDQVSLPVIAITPTRIVCQFNLGTQTCRLYFRRKGSPSMFLLSEVKNNKAPINFKGTEIKDLKDYKFELVKYK